MNRRFLALISCLSIPALLYLILKLLKTRKRVRNRKELTINTNILFWNPSQDPQNPTIAFKESAIQFLRILLKNKWTVYLVSVVYSDKQQQSILALLTDSKLFQYGLDERRVVFCEKVQGISSIVRHIQPGYHMDGNFDVIKTLAPHIPNCVLVAQKATIERVRRTPSISNGALARRASRSTLLLDTEKTESDEKKLDEIVISSGLKNVVRVCSLSDVTFIK